MNFLEEPRERVDETERQAIRAAAKAWAMRLGKVTEDPQVARKLAWRPHLYCPKKCVAVHLMLYAGIAEGVVTGLQEARKHVKGLRVAIVGPEAFMRNPAVLETAASVGASVVILRGGQYRQATEYGDVYEFVYAAGLLLEEGLYSRLAQRLFDAAMQAKSAKKGRLLERLIALVLSQVPGFRVVETNYNTATEEIDVVIENRRVTGIFSGFSEPIVLAECKNRQLKAGKNEYVSFATKIRNRRHSASVGLFFSIAGYTQDFRLEALRDSRQRLVVARFERVGLEKLISCSGEPAAVLIEERVRAATLE